MFIAAYRRVRAGALCCHCHTEEAGEPGESNHLPRPLEPGFADRGVSLRVPSAGWSVLPRRQHGHVSLLLCVVVRGSLGLSQLLWMSWGGAVGGEHWMQSLEAKCLPCPYLAVALAKS